MKRVGIMGGTFNPIHNAHIHMAQAACEQFELDEVLFMPSKNPPHKENRIIVSEEHRKRMIQLAIDGIDKFSFSDFEFESEGTTYTCETLMRLKKKHPDWELYFILGGDSLAQFETWYHPEKIVRYAVILATSREGVGLKETERLCDNLRKKTGGDIRQIRMPQIRISSSDIRRKTEAGESLSGICPEKTERYIKLHGLYNTPVLHHVFCLEEKRIPETFYKSLSSTLRPKRYRHTLGVSDTAAAMAWVHSGDSDIVFKARIAGLLHDCAKYLTGNEMIRECERLHISLTPVEKKNRSLIHGKLGSVYAKERYGVEDSQISSAISWHTTGKPDMTLLEKIIYVADYIEPGRKMSCLPYPLEEVRKASFVNLDLAVRMILENTILYLKENGSIIDMSTVETYDFYR